MNFHHEPVQLHQDARGLVLEPVDLDTLRRQSNSHLVVTQPGEIRGNHYHPKGAEVTVLLGPALVRVKLPEGIQDFHVPAGEAWRFFFPPGVPHAMKNTGQHPMILVAFNTETHNPRQPDVVREPLI